MVTKCANPGRLVEDRFGDGFLFSSDSLFRFELLLFDGTLLDTTILSFSLRLSWCDRLDGRDWLL